MWPQTLQMSDDDCRSILRRLELDTYANVVGVFRAQGGLSDKKVKLLEELRNIFHISQDRHRAEARRVANDECLSTIAKVVSGPNTWQEWSREGRRSYPMLPRVAPQTALGWIANNLAAEADLENAKLPYPAETALAAAEEQNAIKSTNESAEAAHLRYSDKYIVTSDPFKLPDIPAVGTKKNLKRGMNDGQHSAHQIVGKKRNINDSVSPHKQKHITATSNSNISPTSSGNRRTISNAVLQQQRFFYQQQQKAKKIAKAASKREKLPGTGKLGRKPKKLKEQEQRQQREREQFLQQQQQQQDFNDGAYEHHLIPRMDNSDYNLSTNIANVMIDMGNQGQPPQQMQAIDVETAHYPGGNQKTHYMPINVPQHAASKRDISRNLTKLQIPTQTSASPIAQPHKQSETAAIASSQLSSVQKPSTIMIGNKSNSDVKLAQLSTPVQKYIVEDRQPQITTAVGALPPSLLGQQTTSQFIAGLPQSKLRPINTTILPTGTKLTTPAKKISNATVLSPGGGGNSSGGASSPLLDNIIGGNANTPAQLYNLVEGTSTNQANISQQQQQQTHILSQPTAPTHTPPAVIQLHNNEVLRVGSAHPSPGGSTATSTSAQSKVLTTKILPIVLSSNSAKAEASKNGGGASIVSVSAANFVTNSPGATIIKSLPASLLVSGQHGSTSATGNANTVFSTFGTSGGPIYRKQPNILRSSSSTAARQLQTSTVKSGGPQIISNIRLTPAITSTTGVSSSFGSVGATQQSGIFQQQLRNAPSTSTGIRTSVKICQSPNGKVFIQPANMGKLSSGHITQRLLPSTILGGNAGNVTSSGISTLTSKPGSPRIAIQKVQIIPAPLSGNNFSTAANSSQQHTQQRLAATTLTLGGKSAIGSNLFIQARNTTTSAAGAAGGNALTTLGNVIVNKSSAAQSISSNSDTLSGNVKNSSVVVIDAGGKPLQQQHSTKLQASNIKRANIDSSQMITEDTPVDIFVDDNLTETATVGNTQSGASETSSITAVLASNLVTTDQHSEEQAHAEQQQQHQSLPMTVLNATDWEMELDQAKAASSTLIQQQHISSDSLKQQQQSNQSAQLETADTIIIDDSFEDVIIEEEEQDETTATESEQYDSEDQQLQQHIDQQHDDDNDVAIVQRQREKQQRTKFTNERTEIAPAAQMAETNYESVPMCIEDSIETTHIDGGNHDRLSESEDVDVSFSSSGNDNLSPNMENLRNENRSCDSAMKHRLIENEHFTVDHAEESESSQEYNNIEENIKPTTTMSPSTPKIEKVMTATTVSNEAEDDILTIEPTKTEMEPTTPTETATAETTTKVSASLVTVKDYDSTAATDTIETDIENSKTTFDFKDEGKSKQSDAALNAPTAEQ